MAQLDSIAGLPAGVKDDLRAILASIEGRGHACVLIGAAAIGLHGVELPRVTRDLDLVIALDGGFAAIGDLMSCLGLQPTEVCHRFETCGGTRFDVLPAHGEQTDVETIRLPDGGRFSAVGLKDALDSRVVVHADGLDIPVATIPVLAALKLIAATERHREDLADACVCLAGYKHEAEERYVVHFEASSVLTYETAGAYLAARDLAEDAASTTLSAALAAAREMMKGEAALRRVERVLGRADASPLQLLEAFAQGASSCLC